MENEKKAPSSLAGGEVSDGGYDRSDVRYGLHLIANEDCDEVAASYYAKKALAHLAALSPEAPAREGVNDNPLTFGMGALVVNTGKFGGDNAVFIARAKEPGEVGAYTGKSAFDRNVLQPGELVMIFPTAEQAQVVADALVGALTPRHEAPEGAGEHLNAVVGFAAELREALEDLTSIVRGECPSILNEDSGGNGDLSNRIDDLIAQHLSFSALRARSSAPEARDAAD